MTDGGPTVNIYTWNQTTLTVGVVGATRSGTFKRARMWVNRNVEPTVEPEGTSPVEVRNVSMAPGLSAYLYDFRRI